MLRYSTCLALCVLLLLTGCSGPGPADLRPPADSAGDPPAGAEPGIPSGAVLRSASGAPIGIRLGWFKQFENILGYHLYVSDSPIPDSARGNTSMMVEINGNVLIPQPGGSQPVSVDHIFPVQVGETWFYRLTSVWLDDTVEEESVFAGELQVDITPFTVASIENPNVGVGTTLFIDGTNFGQQDPNDLVEFPGVQWVPGSGFQPVMIPGQVMSWTQTRIGVRVPLGATSGPIDVTIGGLTASTPDVFTNSQPYITSLSPLAADMTEEVTLIGNNFGAAQDESHFVKFAGSDMLSPDNYDSWSNTQVVFRPLNLQQYEAKEVRVGAGGFLSNVGFLDLENAPPVPFLTGTPSSGNAPLNVKFEPISSNGVDVSFDPEGASLTFEYDFTDDGTVDATTTDFSIVGADYPAPGIFTCRLTVTDADGGTADTTVQIDVGASAVVLADDGADPTGDYFATDSQIHINYSLSGGAGPYSITWVLVDAVNLTETVLANDTGLSAGAGTHVFDLDTLSFTPVVDSDLIPLGKWTIRGEPSDTATSNNPDASHSWPEGGGSYAVHRYNVAIINDSVGDPGGVQRDFILADLQASGYLVTQIDSANLDPVLLAGIEAAIWPGQRIAAQAEPYSWISAAELGIMTAYIDGGGAMIVLGPPSADNSSGAFPQDGTFNTSYQPYFAVTALADQTAGPDCFSFTRDWDHLVTRSSIIAGDVGVNSPGTSLRNGGVIQMSNIAMTVIPAAFMPGATGQGGCYLGMIEYSTISFSQPGESRVFYLDNIVAGSIGQ